MTVDYYMYVRGMCMYIQKKQKLEGSEEHIGKIIQWIGVQLSVWKPSFMRTYYLAT